MTRARRRAKRGNGCGSLIQADSGLWIAYYSRWIVRDRKWKRKKRSTRTSDRAAAERILSKWIGDERLRAEGVVDAGLERLAAEGKRSIAEHITAFETYLTAKGSTARHAGHTIGAIRRTLEAARIKTLAGLAPSAILEAVAAMRVGEGKDAPAASARTKNHALGAVRALCRWAVKDGRLTVNPLAGVKTFNVEADRKRTRRAFDDDELRRIIDAAESGPVIRGMSGRDRAMLYRLAAHSGLRAGELASLTPASFQLDGEHPAVIVAAAHSKHRREDRQPLRGDLADVLAKWLAGKAKGARVFGDRLDRTAAMLRADMRRAWRRWIREAADRAERRERASTAFLRPEDASGKVADFHSLRASFITSIVRGGASVKAAQQLARHSDPKLTMNVYTRLGIHDLTAALDGLPNLDGLPTREVAQLRRTGTDDRDTSGVHNAGSNRRAKPCKAVRNGALKLADDASGDEGEKAGNLRGNRTVSRSGAQQCVNAPRRTRTFDPLIKSQLLYQLS